MLIVTLLAGTCINKLGADAVKPHQQTGARLQRWGLTTQASSGHRCIVGGDVLQHHDARAVIPLDADPTGCLDQVHAPGVLHIKRVTGERKSCSSVVYSHLQQPGWAKTGRNESSYLPESGENQTSVHLAIEPVDDDSVSGGGNVQLLKTQARCSPCRTL